MTTSITIIIITTLGIQMLSITTIIIIIINSLTLRITTLRIIKLSMSDGTWLSIPSITALRVITVSITPLSIMMFTITTITLKIHILATQHNATHRKKARYIDKHLNFI